MRNKLLLMVELYWRCLGSHSSSCLRALPRFGHHSQGASQIHADCICDGVIRQGSISEFLQVRCVTSGAHSSITIVRRNCRRSTGACQKHGIGMIKNIVITCRHRAWTPLAASKIHLSDVQRFGSSSSALPSLVDLLCALN